LPSALGKRSESSEDKTEEPVGEKIKMFINEIKITEVMPCLADPEKIRFIAYFEKDVSEVFPYINTILKGAIYNHNGRTFKPVNGLGIRGPECFCLK
jgi:ArsR family metal-binding transcriptional regulator